MKILILTQYYYPEEVGASVWIKELAEDLVGYGHVVSVLTAMPNYPQRIIFEGYKQKIFFKEVINSVTIFRSWIKESPSDKIVSRLFNFLSFCISSFILFFKIPKQDIIYSIIPPLPLGLVGVFHSKRMQAKSVVNVQDIYPDIAIHLGILKAKGPIQIFKLMEKFIYDNSNKIIVISEGFKNNLLGKGLPQHKVQVISNWADSNNFFPRTRHNYFRESICKSQDIFIALYSGNLSRNSSVNTIVESSLYLKENNILLVIIGEGIYKDEAIKFVNQNKLKNIKFLGFQPLDEYPQILSAADVTFVTLNSKTPLESVPSKVFKQMAVGRPIIAITKPNNDLSNIIQRAKCGYISDPENPSKLADLLLKMLHSPAELTKMGDGARRYFLENFQRDECIRKINRTLTEK